ncbi:hypothetical protein [Arthrobacter globiformis]|uniref:hypothetical protein n=1 Tax=Arthrobacter globiformis TaxID=1665 RepID=UPI00278A2A01|nr:hypothetical protein [Arthrobacter globiformis]MDQ0864881.1 hypothetical protein [Arthrobacter globiformis]
MNRIQESRTTFLRSWLFWTAGFLALPLAGFAGSAVVGRVDGPLAALAGGAIAGLIIGAGQTHTSSHRLQALKWIPATAIGMSAGLFLGAVAVNYRTSLTDLALMGAINGLVLGSAQALALPRRAHRRWVWAAAMPALWALGWTVTTLFMIQVGQQFIVFGASGALVVTAIAGLLLQVLIPVGSAMKQRRGPAAAATA